MTTLTPIEVTRMLLEKKSIGVDKCISVVTEVIKIKSTGAEFHNITANTLLNMSNVIDSLCDKIVAAGTMGTIKMSHYDDKMKRMKVIIDEPSVIKDIDITFA